MKSIFSLSTLLTHCFLHLRQRWWWCSLPCHSPQAMWWSFLFLGLKSILQLFKCIGCLCEPSPQGSMRGNYICASNTFFKKMAKRAKGRYLSKVKRLPDTLPVCIFFVFCSHMHTFDISLTWNNLPCTTWGIVPDVAVWDLYGTMYVLVSNIKEEWDAFFVWMVPNYLFSLFSEQRLHNFPYNSRVLLRIHWNLFKFILWNSFHWH